MIKITPDSYCSTCPYLLESARTQSQRLSVLQNIILAEFPEYYKQLPDSLEHYLQLRSLFAFVEELWARLTNKYRSVYKAPEIPSEQIPDAVREQHPQAAGRPPGYQPLSGHGYRLLLPDHRG